MIFEKQYINIIFRDYICIIKILLYSCWKNKSLPDFWVDYGIDNITNIYICILIQYHSNLNEEK